MEREQQLVTRIGTYTRDRIEVRGLDLCQNVVGTMSLTQFLLFHWTGQLPKPEQVAMADALLVSLVEHGLTHHVIAARLTYDAAPEALQGAVASGILGAGSVFLGAMEDAARLVQSEVAAWREQGDDLAARAERVVEEYLESGRRVPGFGHPVHRPEDPRAVRLLELARQYGFYGDHCRFVAMLGEALDRRAGEHVTMNVMSAFAGILSDMGFDWRVVKGFALVSRTIGLIGHLYEEMRRPMARELWRLVEGAVRYVPEQPGDEAALA